MIIVLIIIIILLLLLYGVDITFYIKKRYCRFHIGRMDEKAWREAVEKTAKKWVRHTPVVKKNDNSRYVLIDMIKGEWNRLTEPVPRKRPASAAENPPSKKKGPAAYDDLSNAIESLNDYAKTLRSASNEEIRKLTKKILKLIG